MVKRLTLELTTKTPSKGKKKPQLDREMIKLPFDDENILKQTERTSFTSRSNEPRHCRVKQPRIERERFDWIE